ncbi:hypothetical protein LINPERHAP1_LOCUS24079 [Linum perenne]
MDGTVGGSLCIQHKTMKGQIVEQCQRLMWKRPPMMHRQLLLSLQSSQRWPVYRKRSTIPTRFAG